MQFIIINFIGYVYTTAISISPFESYHLPDSKDLVDALGLSTLDKEGYNHSTIGSDISSYTPSDYDENQFSNYSGPSKFKNMLENLNKKWLKLSKISNISNSSSLIEIPYPFFIPGDRFREFYYWDSLWLMRGLLRSKMMISAQNILLNMIYMVNTFGFIPNGGRKYYEGRSQPPVFCQMLMDYLKFNPEDNELVLTKGLEAAVKEYEWFMKYRAVKVIIETDKEERSSTKRNCDESYNKDAIDEEFKDSSLGDDNTNSREIILNQYRVISDKPRLESAREDIIVNNEFIKPNFNSTLEPYFKHFMKHAIDEGISYLDKSAYIYSNLHSTAESGWDFSSRFMDDKLSLASINIISVIPVDLNALMYKNEMIISELYKMRGDMINCKLFLKKAKERAYNINRLLWNKKVKLWNDFDLVKNNHKSNGFYFSNIMPLLYGVDSPIPVKEILSNYQSILFSYEGIPASDVKGTNQQWDFPNVWAPHQSMMVDYLKEIAKPLANKIMLAFIENAYSGYESNEVFYEKYDCTHKGVTGRGGEYKPQTGFGWTNGVLIDFIMELDLESEEIPNYSYKDCQDFINKME